MEEYIQFPDPNLADEDGFLVAGGDLSPEFLVAAYSQGIFPWFSEGQPILWWSPDPRMILLPENFKLAKSLRQLIQRSEFEIRVDTCFEEVIRACAQLPRAGQDGTWITEDMIQAYCQMHQLGLAHSFETFHNNQLVGGLYGISLGAAFFGESMFFREKNASKVAFYYMVQVAKRWNFDFIDAQQSTTHLASLGAEDISRTAFLDRLSSALQVPTRKGSWSYVINSL